MADTLENVDDILPLSPVQAGMLMHAIKGDFTDGAYAGQVLLRLDGALDTTLFQAAWAELMAGRDALRAAFVWEGLEQPLQVIQSDATLEWTFLDWRGQPPAEHNRHVEDVLKAERARGFDVADAPLMRMTLAQESDTSHRLIWTCHHLISDGWSHDFLIASVLEIYDALKTGAALPPRPSAQFRDYIAWLQNHDTEADLTFWKDYVAGVDTPTRLDLQPPDQPPPPGQAYRLFHTLDRSVSDALRDASRKHRVTLSTLMMGVWAGVVRKYVRSNTVSLGIATSVRPAEIQGIETAAGVFVNTQPAIIRFDPETRFADWIAGLERDGVARRKHEHCGLADIQAVSDLPAGTSLFDTLFVFKSFAEPAPQTGAVKVTDTVALYQSEYPFALIVRPGPDIVLEAVFKRGAYASDAVKDLMRQYETALGHIVSAETPDIRELGLSSDWDVPTQTPPSSRPVWQAIDELAAGTPHAPAVSSQGDTLTYAALKTRSDQIGAALLQHGLKQGDRVALALPRGTDAVAAMLGVMKAGGTYIPLDLSYPDARIAATLTAGAPQFTIVDTPARRPDGAPTSHVIALADLSDKPELPTSWAEGTHDALAYILFTSGSTGQPKGVCVSASNLAASTASRPAAYKERVKGFLLLSSLAFDSSVAGIYWTLMDGGHLVMAPKRLEQDPDALLETVRSGGVSHLLTLPALWATLLDMAPREHLRRAGLKTVIVAGDALLKPVVERHRAHLPGVRLVNEYGPTEGTVWCTWHDATTGPVPDSVPIGAPIPGAGITLIDMDGHPAPTGIIGEICIAGPNVAQGYFGETPSDDRFSHLGTPPHPIYKTGDLARWRTDAALAFLGRRDRQVKIRGQRIELAEIEATLRAQPGVRDAAVIAVTHTGRTALAAFTSGADVSRDTLRQTLPDAMVPASIERLDALPTLANGKTDLNALARQAAMPVSAAPSAAQPTTEVQKVLHAIWCDVLGIDAIDLHDSFFDIGGDSMLSIRVVSRARSVGLHLVPHDLFDFPTLAELSHHLSDDAAAAIREITDASVGVTNSDGKGAPFFMIHGRKRMFASMTDALSNRPLGFLFGHWEDADIGPGQTIEGFADDALDKLKAFQPAGPYRLGGFSFGGMIAMEVAQRLRAAGDTVDMLFLLDPPLIAALGGVTGETVSEDPDLIARTFGQKLRKHAARITSVPLAGLPGYLAERVSRLGELYVKAPLRIGYGNAMRRLAGGVPASLRGEYTLAIYAAAYARYEPKVYEGATVLFTTLETQPSAGVPPGWRDHFPNANIRYFSHDHNAMQLVSTALDDWTQQLAETLNAMEPGR